MTLRNGNYDGAAVKVPEASKRSLQIDRTWIWVLLLRFGSNEYSLLTVSGMAMGPHTIRLPRLP